MKKSCSKRLLGMLLSATMIVEMLPISALAVELDSELLEEAIIVQDDMLGAESEKMPSGDPLKNVLLNEDVPTNGICGDNLTWQLDDNILTISGTGDMWDYEVNSHAPWYTDALRESIQTIIISGDVTSIGMRAFEDCSNLTNIAIPDSVTKIGGLAFMGCTELKNITIPNDVTRIEACAFEDCKGLTNIIIPDSVTEINNGAFQGCTSLTDITISKNITKINDELFSGCINLTNIAIPDSVSSIGSGAFENCDSLTYLPIPASVTYISTSTFRYCDGLTSIVIPDNVTGIGYYAFEDCNNLISVTIPSSVTSIGGSAFQSCDSLSNIIISDGVKTIDTFAFSYCPSLASILLPNSITSIGGWAFQGCTNLTSITIPENVTSIDYYTFRECINLKYITFLGDIESIGEDAFAGCAGLSDVYYTGSEQDWNTISIGNNNESLTNATIHYNSTGPDDPGIDQPETSMGNVSFFSKWDSNTRQAYFDYSALAYSVTDNTEISPNQSIDQLVGKYVLVKMSESSPLEISSIKPVDSKIGTVTNVIVGNGNPAVTSLQFEDGTYAVVNGLIVSEGIIGKQVLYHLLSGEIVGYTELQKKTGTLEKWDSNSGQLVIDGVTYFTNYMTDESLSTSADQLIDKRVEILCQEGVIASHIFQITEAKEYYQIQIYASTPNLSTNINGTIDITCSLYRDDKLVEDWVDPAFVIGNDKVISTSDYTLKDGSYYFTITGLAEGRSSLTVSDSYSGAYITVDISVGKVTSRAYSYRMDDIPSFVPNVYGESVLTNFYNVNDLYVNNFSYTEASDGGYDVSFNVYNQGYMYGAVDVYDKNGKWIQSKKIDKFSDISSLWDTGEAIYHLIADSFDGRLLSYTSGVLSKETPVSVHVPKDGYLTISNNFSESPGTFLYNTVDYLMLSVNTIADVSVNGVETSQIADDIIDKAIRDIDFQQEFMDKFNEIALNVSQTSLEFGFGEAAKAITVDAEDLLDSIGLNWKASAESVVGGLESVFVELTGPVGIVLDKCFAFTKLTSYVVQTNDICYSTNAPSILIHVPASTSNTTTVQGVTVTTGTDTIDSEAVLQVFRIANTDAIVFIDGEIPVEEYKLYNICFIKNGEEIKPNRKVTVKIPIPSGYDKERCVVYRQETDERWVILQAVVEGNYLVFETDHFSLYAIAETNRGELPENPNIPVTGVELNTQGITLSQIGSSYQLKADVTPSNATNQAVTWASNNPSVVTVSNNGLVTAVSEGTATITVTTEDGQKCATCVVTVCIESSSNGAGGGGTGDSVTPTSYAIAVGDTNGGTITISPKTASKGKTVTITAMPDDGFTLETLSVSDKNGKEIKLTKETETSYTFKMPASKVTVSATFAVVVAEPEPVILPFDDVLQTAWYYEAVKYVYSNHLMQGTAGATFSPEVNMSRGMIATVLYRSEGTPALAGGTAFGDVGVNEWYTDAIQWATENDIMNGYGNNRFGPMDNVTREQLAVILYNYTASEGVSVDVTGDLPVFGDAKDTSDWAKEAISWAVGVGLLAGKGNGILDPTATATRAEVAQMLMNYFTKVV